MRDISVELQGLVLDCLGIEDVVLFSLTCRHWWARCRIRFNKDYTSVHETRTPPLAISTADEWGDCEEQEDRMFHKQNLQKVLQLGEISFLFYRGFWHMFLLSIS